MHTDLRFAWRGRLAGRGLSLVAMLILAMGMAGSMAAIGHYSVVAAFVRHREGEIALRVALGPAPVNVRALVLGEALWRATRLLRGLTVEGERWIR